MGAVVTATAFVVVFLPFRSNEDSESPPSQSTSPVVASEQPESGEVQGSESPSTASSAPIEASTTVSIGGLDSLSQVDNDFERTQSLYVLLQHIGEEELYDLLEESKSVNLLYRTAVQRALIQKLATIDPRRALDQIADLEDSDSEELVKSVFGHWAVVDLDKALAQAKSLNTMEKWAAMRGIFGSRSDMSEDERLQLGQELGETQFVQVWNSILQEEEYAKNPEESWYEIVEEAQQDNMQINLLHSIAEAWIKEDGLEVIDKIVDSVTNQQTRTHVLMLAFRSAATTDPQGALDRVLQLENDPYQSIASTVVSVWSESDPKSTINSLSALEPGSKRDRLLESAMRTWANNHDPFVMLEELGGMAKEVQLIGQTAALYAISHDSPERASELLGNMPDSDGKRNVASSIVWSWSQKDPTEALQWVLTSPDIAAYRQQLLNTTLRNLATKNPELAMETALAQSAEPDGDRLVSTVISSIAQDDVSKALEFLPQIPEGASKLSAYGSVGVSLITEGDADKALDLAKNVGESERDTYYHLLSMAWAGTDPDQLLDSIDRFPSDASKSKAAAVLTLMHKMQPTLNDKQVEEAKKYLSEEDKEELEKGGMGLLNLGPYMEMLNF